MTERELQLIDELEKEKAQQEAIENLIAKKQSKLKACKQKIVDLELAIKEEQLNSIRESIVKNGLDFDAFREALENGQISSLTAVNKSEITKTGGNANV